MVQNGFSVGATAAITALGISANLWRFVWAPVTDLTLTLHKWYLIGISFCSAALIVLCFVPIQLRNTKILTTIVFLSQVAATFVVGPVGGFMAKTVEDHKKGRAGGWYQAGNLGGMGMGGGAGIWLSTHYSYRVAGVSLALTMMFCAAILLIVPQVRAVKTSLSSSLKIMWLDMKILFSSRVALFTILMILTPIGMGAAAYIWSSVGKDWDASANTVALTTGLLSGIMSAIGCVFGGWFSDKAGIWWSYFVSGGGMALVTLLMSVFPFTPDSYMFGVLGYAFMIGFAYAAYSAMALRAIGKGLASTKYALISSISNIAPIYMTAYDGWLHDAYGIKAMLLGETILGFGFIAMSLLLLQKTKVYQYKPIL